jgi:hypothetical protein
MADLVFPVSTFITAYSSAGSVSWWAASISQPFETIFRETTSANSIFDTTEILEMIEGGISKGNATYAGTVTHLGVEYPAFNIWNGQLLVYGVSLTQLDYPDIASLNLDTSDYPFCFLAGTAIATPEGPVAVETLRIGDLVLTADGHRVPVKWIGRQTVSTRFGPAERLMPVRFAAGSLGEGLPHNDLTVTADHGMLVDGVICHAGALVNGTTITRVPLSEMGETYMVYHIETDEHEIILANGAPAETFIDNVSRRVFDNFAEFEALYGDVPEMEELPYPRAMSARQVPGRIRALLNGRRAA